MVNGLPHSALAAGWRLTCHRRMTAHLSGLPSGMGALGSEVPKLGAWRRWDCDVKRAEVRRQGQCRGRPCRCGCRAPKMGWGQQKRLSPSAPSDICLYPQGAAAGHQPPAHPGPVALSQGPPRAHGAEAPQGQEWRRVSGPLLPPSGHRGCWVTDLRLENQESPLAGPPPPGPPQVQDLGWPLGLRHSTSVFLY